MAYLDEHDRNDRAFGRFPQPVHFDFGLRASVQERSDGPSLVPRHIAQFAIIVPKNKDRVRVVDVVRLSLERDVVIHHQPLTRRAARFRAESPPDRKIAFVEKPCSRPRGIACGFPFGA